ncbi:hypothetical protein HPB48_025437 [Haemaphysalis longicornis]|uniref:Mitochondrial phosphate carrier protein n=1 Tax=Haemaphysalis longicornis TaxID=44386 RepID=A0A9J6GZ03_HAELO|nr:hypothetical protein HPB48_025437 [Haemaphysalis longicornis]
MNSFSQLLETAKRSPFVRPFAAKCDSPVDPAPAAGTMVPRNFSACAADEPVVFGSMKYYALCGFGGILSCGITHTAIVPLDLVKCRIQTNPGKYKGIFQGFSVTIKEEGARGLGRGWAPTAIGYSLQGLGKFGFYEVFKIAYSNLLGEVLLASSSFTECPPGVFCAVVSHPADTVVSKLNQEKGSTAIEAAKKLGMAGLWKGLTPRIIMIGTLTALQWFIYDGVKVWLRLPRPPPPEMPQSLKDKLAKAQN